MLILLFGVAASVFGSVAWAIHVRAQDVHTFDQTASAQADALSIALQRDADLAATARTLIETTPNLTNAQFSTWFRLLGTRSSYPGSFGLLYLANVPASGLSTFAHRAKVEPPLGLALPGPFSITPSASKPPYCLTRVGVVQVSSSIGLSASDLTGLLGYARPDLNYCARAINALLRETATTGRTAAVTLSWLIAKAPHEPGMPNVTASLQSALAKSGLIATITPVSGQAPVSSGTVPSATKPLGWILEIYQAGSVLGPVLKNHHEAATLSYVNPDGALTVLAQFGLADSSSISRTYHLKSSGAWSVTLAALPPVAGLSPMGQGVAIRFGGLLLSLLMFILIKVLSNSRTRALELVEERTSQLRHLALHDGLTSLANRELIFDRAEQILSRARRERREVAALFVDLDQFKDVNDSYGHAVGDRLLREVAVRFASALPASAMVGRLGGDEFIALVDALEERLRVELVADKLLKTLFEPFSFDGERPIVIAISASIGIARGERDSAGDLLRDADIALYEAKASARGSYVVFHPEMQAAIATRIQLEHELRQAIRDREFFLTYQPVYSLEDRRLIGAEALLRWRHPRDGVVLPGRFIPSLEATGMIREVGRFVLETACAQGASWAKAGYPLSISVNVSGQQLDEENFVAAVKEVLIASGLKPGLLTLEITETTLMRNAELSAARLRVLKELGVKLSIDDFGTGYCSLAYLQQFPVDCLKIDQSFVAQMEVSAEGAAPIHTIVQMGRDLGLETLAEGIETPEQLARLRLEQCTNGQGFLFARPLAATALDKLLQAASPRVRFMATADA